MELKKFKFNCEIQKYNNPKTYYKFEIINLQFINSDCERQFKRQRNSFI